MIQIRRVFTHLEDILHEFGPVADVPLLRGAIGAVLTNPYAGRYEPDILPMMDALQDVGLDMAQRLLKAMAVPAECFATGFVGISHWRSPERSSRPAAVA